MRVAAFLPRLTACSSNWLLLLTAVLGFTHSTARAQVDNLQKNTQVLAQLDAQYQRELAADPTGAAPHWHHAKALAQVTFRAADTAGQYYELAIQRDSTTAALYQDYAAYLLRYHAYPQARALYEKGLRRLPGNAELQAGQQQVQDLLRQQAEYAALHRVPVSAGAGPSPTTSFAERSNLAALLPLTTAPDSEYAYPRLAAAFAQDPAALSAHQMYLLLLGTTTQPGYQPYNYAAEQALQQLAAEGKLAELISQAQRLLAQEPVNVLALRELLYAYRKSGNPAGAAQVEQRLTRIFEGLRYSGDGSCAQPYVAIGPREEYVFVQYLGYAATRTATQTSCAGFFADKVLVADPAHPQEAKAIYFNYTPIVLSMKRK